MIELAEIASLTATVGAAFASVKGLQALRQKSSNTSATSSSDAASLDQLRQSPLYKALDSAMKGERAPDTVSDLEAQLAAEDAAKQAQGQTAGGVPSKIVIKVRSPDSVKPTTTQDVAPQASTPPKIYITPTGNANAGSSASDTPAADSAKRPIIKVLRNGRYVPIGEANSATIVAQDDTSSWAERKNKMVLAIAQFQRGLSTATVEESLAGIALLNRTVDFCAAPATVNVKDIVLVKKVHDTSNGLTYYVVGLGLSEATADVWLTTLICDQKHRWGIYTDTGVADMSALARLSYGHALVKELVTY